MNHSCWLAVSLLAQTPVSEGPTIPQLTLLDLDLDVLAVDEAQQELASEVKFPLPTSEWFAPEFSAMEMQAPAPNNSRTLMPAAIAATPQPLNSMRSLQASNARQWILVNGQWELSPERNLTIKREPTAPTPSEVRPTSGAQLYQQRLAALKAGKIYTRLPADSYATAWTKATEQPTHPQWKSLLALEAKAIASGQGSNKLNIMMGDSLSLWFPTDRLSHEGLWLNQSVSGETTQHILSRIHHIRATQPEKIYLMAGINDLRQGATDTTILTNLRTIIAQLRQNHPQTQLIVQSILPTRLAALPSDRIRRLNEQIEAIALQYDATYIDLYSYFTDSQGILRRELTTDGIHLSVKGYELWQQVLSYNP